MDGSRRVASQAFRPRGDLVPDGSIFGNAQLLRLQKQSRGQDSGENRLNTQASPMLTNLTATCFFLPTPVLVSFV
jgi:hypothetical protein